MTLPLVNQLYLDHFTKAPGMYAACTDDTYMPETVRVLAGWGNIESNTISFAVSDPYSKHFLSLAQAGQRVSLVAVTLNDYLAYQYKGSIISVTSCTKEDLQKVNTYVEEFCKLVVDLGIDPQRYPVGFVKGPYSTITFDLDSIFDQTPRVGAGAVIQRRDMIHD